MGLTAFKMYINTLWLGVHVSSYQWRIQPSQGGRAQPGWSVKDAHHKNQAVTYYIAKDSVPISTVEKPGFKHMVSKLNPRYQLPSRWHFSDFEKDNIVASSLKDGTFFAATTDFWTSGTCHPYLTITVYFIDREWHFKSFSHFSFVRRPQWREYSLCYN